VLGRRGNPGGDRKIDAYHQVHALAQGYSGIRLETIERIRWHIENDVLPVVPEKEVWVLR
jgi:histidine ammonia-lyase